MKIGNMTFENARDAFIYHAGDQKMRASGRYDMTDEAVAALRAYGHIDLAARLEAAQANITRDENGLGLSRAVADGTLDAWGELYDQAFDVLLADLTPLLEGAC